MSKPMPGFWDQLMQNGLDLPQLIPFIVLALLTGFVGFAFTRWNKHLDRRAALKPATLTTSDPSQSTEDAGRRFLRKMAHGREQRDGPPRWVLRFVFELGAYELENAGGDIVHDLKIDIFTKGRDPKMITRQTIQLPQLHPGLPLTLPLGAPRRADKYVICVRWDDSYGIDQLERLPVSESLIG